MTPATRPRPAGDAPRLLVVGPSGRLVHQSLADLPDVLLSGDLLVVNDAATLPASLNGVTEDGRALEVRLAGPPEHGLWPAVLFGAGDWRTRTEDRPAPPSLAPGARILLGPELDARIAAVSRHSARLVSLRFALTGAALWRAIYRHGRPVQYAHLERPLVLWDVQTPYGGRPWAVEAPSAGLSLRAGLLERLRARGIAVSAVTHAAGLSSTGDARLDALLPLPERYSVPASTVAAVERCRAESGRVVALGTSVVRALESAAERRAALRATSGVTELLLGPGSPRFVVDALVTGVHERDTSHFRLLEAFLPEARLHRALDAAERAGYRGHEFGDLWLLFGSGRARARSPGKAG